MFKKQDTPQAKAYRKDLAFVTERNIKEYAQSKGWNISDSSVRATKDSIVFNPGSKTYLKYVDQGTRPFLMTSLEGKTVPINGGFRVVSGVGLPGVTSYTRNGVEVRQYKLQKWRHPGIKPHHFVEKSYRLAKQELKIDEHKARASIALVSTMATLKDIFRRTK